ncbi:MAG: DUF1080 domain-containing protein [Candidatus Omnitrophica bacterium]|nr:DUF1080 domain-containing protein [Candidatus Omnitrophota bacterium]
MNARGLLGVVGLALALGGAQMASSAEIGIQAIPGQAEVGTVEIHGLAAGVFDPSLWEKGSLHFLPDTRSPILAPRNSGVFRNIYAPSAVETRYGWRLFYGAWDGVPSGNDRIYSVETGNFLDFDERHLIIDHGPFIHVCNVSAIPGASGGYELMCTAYPDSAGLNKPAYFSSPDGKTWNGAPAPYSAQTSDLISIEGYPPFAAADINGMNVLLKEEDSYRLYFCNFKDRGQVFRASSKDPKHFQYEGHALESRHFVNDVKKVAVGGEAWYLMALHGNGPQLFYSLSTDGLHFSPEQELAGNLGAEDKHMVAVGWVLRGSRVLGFLYGAGAVPSLDRNRLFGRWLQKRVVFVAEDGTRYEPDRALGPDRQILKVPADREIKGRFEFHREDGVTRIGDSIPAAIRSGQVFQADILPSPEEGIDLLESGLSGWVSDHGGDPTGWIIKEGILTFTGQGSSIRLKESGYGDFLLSLEYRLPVGGNSGVFIRNFDNVLDTFHAFEIQVLDDKAEVYKDIKPYQHAGSIYAVVPAAKDAIRPAGEWNRMEILCLGSRIRVRINGEGVADADVDAYEQLRHRPRRGTIGLQNHGSTLEFRSLRLVRLD